MKLIAKVKYHACPRVYGKGDVFDVESKDFVPYLMEDLTSKPLVAVKVEVPKAPSPSKEDKPKIVDKPKKGKWA